MIKILNQINKITKRCIKKTKEFSNKVKKFYQKIKEGAYLICAVCCWCLYKCIVRLIEHRKYILTAELYGSMRSFHDKIHISGTCQKHDFRN